MKHLKHAFTSEHLKQAFCSLPDNNAGNNIKIKKNQIKRMKPHSHAKVHHYLADENWDLLKKLMGTLS